MDFTLRCNSLKCRTPLADRAVVTTCSHIFCLKCADALGLLNAQQNNRICPACEAWLKNADDIVETSLNPSEDYKTSVLSGLSPSIIMECCGRGLNFYSYQATQEIIYQEYQVKSIADRYTILGSQMDQIIHEANSEITTLQKKLEGFESENNELRRKNNSLNEAYNEKMRQHQKSQTAHDKLRKKLLESDVQIAAEDAVERTISSTSRTSNAVRPLGFYQQFPVDSNGIEQIHHHQKSGSPSRGDLSSKLNHPTHHRPQDTGRNGSGTYTPSQQRTRLPVLAPQTNRQFESSSNYHSPSFTRSIRQPLEHSNRSPVNQGSGSLRLRQPNNRFFGTQQRTTRQSGLSSMYLT